MAVSGIFGKKNLSGIKAKIEFPEEIYAQAIVPLKVVLLNNRKFMPAFMIRIRFGGYEAFFPIVEAGRQREKYISAVFAKRGRYSFKDNYLCSVFPFNFFIRCRKMDDIFELIVFPKIKKCEYHDMFQSKGRHRGEEPTGRTGYDGDVVSFRSYITGDPLKYIHWKATAKTGRLKTKELSALSHRPVVIDLEKMPAGDIEEKISCATYIVLSLFKNGIPFRLKIRDRVYALGDYAVAVRGQTKTKKGFILSELALYDAKEPDDKN